ncbi:YaaR family protein [uncultured Clostridium sp.]|uniref:YaaR family protein n=1 Tax=uncultured Clostridium sp. TaxID=59620 RepID=UPI00260A00A8|nr:YaaR family protein [uncultured Clostridium sp.]
MEIRGTERNQRTEFKKEDSKINAKKEFSQNFNDAKDRKSNEELQKMIKDIKSKGDRLILNKSYGDVRAYKRLIKDYLKEVLAHMYKIKNNTSFWQTQYFITVETIDEKLENLTVELLKAEKDNLKVAGTVDEIQGMIVDIYK